MPADPPALARATVVVSAGRPEQVPDAPLNTPITMASTYVAGGDLEYGRYTNPTWTAFEEALGALEGGRCLTFASGLAAVSTILDLVAQGDKVVAPRHAYNGVTMQLADLEARGRVDAVLVDVTDTEAVAVACADAAIVWLESPTNPALEVADLSAIIAAAHAAGARVVVDNTFATPLLQRPLELGADLVVHSATKYLAGHSDLLMGAIITRDDEVYAASEGPPRPGRRGPGGVRGVARAARAADSAPAGGTGTGQRPGAGPSAHRASGAGRGPLSGLRRASSRSCCPGAPSPGTLLTRRTTLWVHATSLGGVESTFERRRRWATEPLTIPEGLVRMSVGIEDVEDLWADLAAALATIDPS